MKPDIDDRTVDTNLGELIGALIDASLEFSEDEKAANLVASQVLGLILRKSHPANADVAEALAEFLPEEQRLQ